MSAPETNAVSPAPVMIRTPTSAVDRERCPARARISFTVSRSSAFLTPPGRSIVSVAIWSAISTRMFDGAIGRIIGRYEAMRSILSIFLALAAFSAVAGAQDKPDFAGTWKLTDPATPEMFTPSQMVDRAGRDRADGDDDRPDGRVQDDLQAGWHAGQSPLDFNGQTIDRTTKATWNGNKLALSTTSDMGGQTIEIKSVLSLARTARWSSRRRSRISRAAARQSRPRRRYKKS